MGRRVGRGGVGVVAGIAVSGLISIAAVSANASPLVAWGTTPSAPAGARAVLFGVASAVPGDAVAVGGYNPGQAPSAVLTSPYAEHWNGSTWTATAVAVPAVYPGVRQRAQLEATVAISATDAWAVGHVDDGWSLASQTLAYHWDGATWTRLSTPNPGGSTLSNRLYAVAARNGSDVWAVGDAGYPDGSLLLHWNGTAWAQVALPSIGRLHAVAVDASRVWVASDRGIEQFNGTTWTSLPAAPVINGALSPTGLAVTSSGLWAVGTVYIPYFDGSLSQPYAAVWNGAAWTVIPNTGVTSTDSGYSSVTAHGSTVWATTGTTVVRLNLTGTTTEVTPALVGLLTAVTSDSAGNPWAVGWTITNATPTPVIINAPGIGQGGITVAAHASGATITWIGPSSGSGKPNVSGNFAVGGLPAGGYTIITTLGGCQPGIATATVTAGQVTTVNAPVTC